MKTNADSTRKFTYSAYPSSLCMLCHAEVHVHPWAKPYAFDIQMEVRSPMPGTALDCRGRWHTWWKPSRWRHWALVLSFVSASQPHWDQRLHNLGLMVSTPGVAYRRPSYCWEVGRGYQCNLAVSLFEDQYWLNVSATFWTTFFVENLKHMRPDCTPLPAYPFEGLELAHWAPNQHSWADFELLRGAIAHRSAARFLKVPSSWNLSCTHVQNVS